MYRKCYKCSNNNPVLPEYENCYEDSCSDVGNQMDLYDDCECGYSEYNAFPENPLLAQSYVPFQKLDKTFVPCVGLKMGTIYPELVSPYSPGQSMEFIDYLRRRNEIKEGCNKC